MARNLGMHFAAGSLKSQAAAVSVDRRHSADQVKGKNRLLAFQPDSDF
jgi:hypothetical protein